MFKKSKNHIETIIKENKDVKFTIYKLNDTDFLDLDIASDNISFDFKVIGNSVPNIDGTPGEMHFYNAVIISDDDTVSPKDGNFAPEIGDEIV